MVSTCICITSLTIIIVAKYITDYKSKCKEKEIAELKYKEAFQNAKTMEEKKKWIELEKSKIEIEKAKTESVCRMIDKINNLSEEDKEKIFSKPNVEYRTVQIPVPSYQFFINPYQSCQYRYW